MKRGKIIVAAVLLAIAGAASFAGLRYWTDNIRPNFREKYVLYVYPGMTASEAIDSIVTGAGVFRRGSLERCSYE